MSAHSCIQLCPPAYLLPLLVGCAPHVHRGGLALADDLVLTVALTGVGQQPVGSGQRLQVDAAGTATSRGPEVSGPVSQSSAHIKCLTACATVHAHCALYNCGGTH